MNEIEKKKKISTTIILIVVALLLIAFAYYLFGPNGSLGGTLFKAGVADITLDSSDLTVEVGDYVDIKATSLNGTLKYEVLNSSIATVNSNGRVTGKKEGTTKVKVIDSDGNSVNCNIIVKPAKVTVESIVLNKTDLIIKVGESEVLVATVNPTNATDKTIKWDSSDESVATVVGGKVFAKRSGTTVITAYNSENKVATCTVVVM